MSTTPELRRLITDLVTGMMDADHEVIEAAVDAASDYLATGNRTDDMVTESILDGIRWGFRAAATVELGGGTVLRIRTPGGVGITHEWLDKPSPDSIRRIMEEVSSVLSGPPAGDPDRVR